MKKHLLLAILGLAFSDRLLAQVQVGVRAGVHWSTVVQSRALVDHRFRPGFAVAVPIQLSLSEHWKLRLEPAFVQNGWRMDVDYTDVFGVPAGTGDMSLRYDVTELPLLLSFRSQKRPSLAYYGLFGPSFGYMMGGNYTIKNGETTVYSQDELFFENRFAAGIWGGGGVEFPVGKLSAFLDARYQYGFKRTLPFGNDGVTHGITVSVGCWLPTKK